MNQDEIKYLTLLFIIINVFSNSVYSEVIPNLYNTGVNDAGNALPLGIIEAHYSLSSNIPVTNAITRSKITGHWIEAPLGSSWISVTPNSDNAPIGYYSYSIRFDLSGLDPETAIISGKWASDNSAKIYLNDIDTNRLNTHSGFDRLYDFVLNQGFINGINKLTFTVFNAPQAGNFNPTGLLISQLSGTADRNIDNEGIAIGIAQCQENPSSCGIIINPYDGSISAGIAQCQNNPDSCNISIHSLGGYTLTEFNNAKQTGKDECFNNPESCGINSNTIAQCQANFASCGIIVAPEEIQATTINSNLDIYIPSINYITPLKNKNYFINFKFSHEENNQYYWMLKNFGENGTE
jgi:hypothetical protein